jgi:pimeloyl-ACP methyl ester carboxylesterase
VNQPLFDFGGSGRVLHLAVANGFPPLTYRALLDPLAARYHVVSLPPRPLWDAPPPPESINSWRSLAVDLMAGLRAYDLNGVIAVGHSFGSVASMLAVSTEPKRFAALILLDPTLLSPRRLWMLAVLRRFGLEGRMPLVRGALRRRSRFTSRDEAFTYWRGKPLFRDWSDDALGLYTDAMVCPSAEGGLELTWPPEWEAHYYRTIYAGSWQALETLRGTVPILCLRGEMSDVFDASAGERFQHILPDATLEVVAGGHLFPLSAPDATRAVIEKWLTAKRL